MRPRTTDRVTEAVLANLSPDPIPRRVYLTYKALMDGANIWMAIEAVASTLIEHPELNTDEEKTFEEWERD